MNTQKTLNTLALSTLFAYGAAVQAAVPVALAPVQALKIQGIEKSIAVLPSGLALYTFDPDQGAEKPACNGTCAEKWPPILVEAAEIVGDERLGTIQRTSGLTQLTIGGKPVYTFFLDRKAGDVKGDGLGNVWHLIEL
jgi:predicted lipoprotein with Yx(FWY)xxD motif